MCLAKVDPEPKTNRKSGYKVVIRCSGGEIRPEYRFDDVCRYDVGKWMEDPVDFRIPWSDGDYQTGFHIFLSLKGAIRWGVYLTGKEIRKVRFDDVVATGIQNLDRKEYRCVVARKICIGGVVNV